MKTKIKKTSSVQIKNSQGKVIIYHSFVLPTGVETNPASSVHNSKKIAKIFDLLSEITSYERSIITEWIRACGNE